MTVRDKKREKKRSYDPLFEDGANSSGDEFSRSLLRPRPTLCTQLSCSSHSPLLASNSDSSCLSPSPRAGDDCLSLIEVKRPTAKLPTRKSLRSTVFDSMNLTGGESNYSTVDDWRDCASPDMFLKSTQPSSQTYRGSLGRELNENSPQRHFKQGVSPTMTSCSFLKFGLQADPDPWEYLATETDSIRDSVDSLLLD